MKIILTLLLLTLVCAGANAQTAIIPSSAEVTMSLDSQKQMGVKIESLASSVVANSIPAYVSAIDVGPLLQLESDLISARAAALMSSSEAARLTRLASQDQSASVQSVETANAAAAADKSRLDLLGRRLRLEWSPALAEKLKSESSFLSALSLGETTLVRADAPSSPNGIFGEVAIETNDEEPISATPIGHTGVADLRMQTIGLYALVTGDAASMIKPGRVFKGEIRLAEMATGVMLPREAVIRVDGASWVYVQMGADVFSRHEVSHARKLKEGWFVTDGIEPGDMIVTAGAESVLAAERADESAESD